jgi:hypothetical protein
MINTVRTIGPLSFLVFMLSALAAGQQQLQAGAPPAASGPIYDVGLGYSYLTVAVPGAEHVNLYGMDAGGQIHLTPRWGAAIDSNYARSFNVPGTPRDAYTLGLHAGPVFYAVERGNTRLFVHVLAGGTREGGAVPISHTEYFHGWLLRPSYAAGVGVEHALSGRMALRVSGDYLCTRFYDSVGAVQPQNNFRMTASLVFRLKRPYGGRH